MQSEPPPYRDDEARDKEEAICSYAVKVEIINFSQTCFCRRRSLALIMDFMLSDRNGDS